MTKNNETTLQHIAVSHLHYTPDRRDMGDLKALASLIERYGYPPLEVVKDDSGYEIVDGRRRYESLKLLKFPKIECYVLEACDPDFGLTRNTGRLQLTPVEILDNMLEAGDQFNTAPLSPESIKNFATKAGLSIDDALKLRTLSRCGEDIKGLVHAKQMPLNVAILTVNLGNKVEAFVKYYQEDRPSYRQAKDWFRQNKAAQELSEAKFDTKGCKGCNCHGDSNPALFDTAEGNNSMDDDRCFNPVCYKRKTTDWQDGMKLRARKWGFNKAGISMQPSWNFEGLIKYEVAARIEPDKCAECKLIKWICGYNAENKPYALYCPTNCPNIKLPKGVKKSEGNTRGQPYVSLHEKLEKDMPLTTDEKQQIIADEMQKAATGVAGNLIFTIGDDGPSGWAKGMKPESVADVIKLAILMNTGITRDVFDRIVNGHKDKAASWMINASLEKHLFPYLLDELLNSAMYAFGNQSIPRLSAMVEIVTGKPLDLKYVATFLPDKVKALTLDVKAKTKKK